jgi:hypothetical protein
MLKTTGDLLRSCRAGLSFREWLKMTVTNANSCSSSSSTDAHATQVSFNGTPAAIISDTPTYLVTIVPPGATSGRITVTTSAGTASWNGWFVVTTRRGRISCPSKTMTPATSRVAGVIESSWHATEPILTGA